MSTPLFPVGQAAVDALSSSERATIQTLQPTPFTGFPVTLTFRDVGNLIATFSEIKAWINTQNQATDYFIIFNLNREARFTNSQLRSVYQDLVKYNADTGRSCKLTINTHGIALKRYLNVLNNSTPYGNADDATIRSQSASLFNALSGPDPNWVNILVDGRLSNFIEVALGQIDWVTTFNICFILKHGARIDNNEIRILAKRIRKYEQDTGTLPTTLILPTDSYTQEAEYL